MRTISMLAVLVVVSWSSQAIAATVAQKCESGRNGAAGKFAACLHKAEQKFLAKGEIDTAARAAALDLCETKFSAKWAKLDTKGGSSCPTAIYGDVRDFIDSCVISTEGALGGAPIPLDIVTCNANLATAQAEIAEADLLLSSILTGNKYGYPTAYPDSVGESGDLLAAFAVTLPAGFVSHLSYIGIVASSATIRLALYADSAGVPGALLASTSAVPFQVGAHEIAIPLIQLAAGQYWIASNASDAHAMPADFSGSILFRIRSLSIGDPWPDPFSPTGGFISSPTSYYVKM